MVSIVRVGLANWNIISLCVASLMTRKNSKGGVTNIKIIIINIVIVIIINII